MQNTNPQIKTDVDLSKLSTMRVGGKGKYLIEIASEDALKRILGRVREMGLPILVLGGGSNTLFTGDFNGIILQNKIQGIEKIEENETHVKLRVGGGVNWHDFVEYCVNNNLAGNENLAYIPGTVGAAPVQNIAAYGQVQEDTFINLEAINLRTGKKRIFEEPECEFAYRTSIFKQSEKGKYIITNVTYQLKKASEYIPETSYHSRYESLAQFLPKNKKKLTLKDIFKAVIKLRKHKLPQVEEIGTLGSFFLNPFVSVEHLNKLKERFPDIQYYPIDKMQYPALDDPKLKNVEIVKIPAGWLIEEFNFRGKYVKNVGSSEKHSLCLVVKGIATGKEVLDFAKIIQDKVYSETGIKITPEVNII